MTLCIMHQHNKQIKGRVKARNQYSVALDVLHHQHVMPYTTKFTAPQNPAAFEISPHISANSSQYINIAPEISPHGKGSIMIYMYACTCALYIRAYE